MTSSEVAFKLFIAYNIITLSKTVFKMLCT